MSLNFWNTTVHPRRRARAMRALLGQKYGALHLRDEVRYLKLWAQHRLRPTLRG